MRGRVPAIIVLLAAAAAGACGGDMGERLRTGDHWYRMEGPEGKAQGYAHLVVGAADGGGRRVDWELKIGFPGGSYEEWRSMTIDEAGALVAASYSTGEDFSTSLSRRGDEWSVSTSKGGRAKAEIVEVPDGALTSMLFVLAATLPQEDGASDSWIEIDESKGFAAEGTTVFTWEGVETIELEGEEVPAHRFRMERESGGALPIWVGEDRAILMVDWGGGNVMRLSSTSTEHLFAPEPPAVTEVDRGADVLVVTGRFPGLTPEQAYRHFVEPELLTRWWPPEAEVDPSVGGRYLLSWPEQDWVMRGEVKALESGKRFAFTWRWDHQGADAPTREVEVAFEPDPEGGTRLTLTHGPYGESEEEQEARRSHLSGWEHFLTRLRNTVP